MLSTADSTGCLFFVLIFASSTLLLCVSCSHVSNSLALSKFVLLLFLFCSSPLCYLFMGFFLFIVVLSLLQVIRCSYVLAGFFIVPSNLYDTLGIYQQMILVCSWLRLILVTKLFGCWFSLVLNSTSFVFKNMFSCLQQRQSCTAWPWHTCTRTPTSTTSTTGPSFRLALGFTFYCTVDAESPVRLSPSCNTISYLSLFLEF